MKILSGKDQLSEKNENEELTLEMMNAGPDEAGLRRPDCWRRDRRSARIRNSRKIDDGTSGDFHKTGRPHGILPMGEAVDVMLDAFRNWAKDPLVAELGGARTRRKTCELRYTRAPRQHTARQE